MKKVIKEYVSYDELYKAYLDCRKRKRRSNNEIDFEIEENIKLYRLWVEINTNTYEIGKSICFIVKKPVYREVFAADFRDRIIHHLFINRIIYYLEKEFIDDTYSCRVGKGTYYGIKKCYEYIKECSNNYTEDCYILKCDLKSFFMTINKDILYEILYDFLINKCGYYDDELWFMSNLLYKIIYDEPAKKCIIKGSINNWNKLPKDKSLFYVGKNKGLPIGNLTSQIFANYYLNYFDHYIIEELGFKFYGRYVDDFYIIHKSKEMLSNSIQLIKEKLSVVETKLHPNKTYFQYYKKGVKFIGSVIKPNRIYIGNRTKGNLWYFIKNNKHIFDNKSLIRKNIEHFISSVNSYLGFMIHYSTYNIRRKIIFENENMLNFYKYGYTNGMFSKIIVN